MATLLLLHRRHLSPAIPYVRTFIDARVPYVRDRALDHAVEKEKYLIPFLNLKDLLLSPSHSSSSVPLSSIVPLSSSLLLPFRPIRFLRLFPSAFLQSFPDPHSPTHPHFSPSPPLIHLHDQQLQIHSSSRSDSADRLLRLLMLSPSRRLPLNLVHSLRFHLGLPSDFTLSLLPHYPDYFQLVPSKTQQGQLDLELVCYSKDLAVSEMERYAMKTGGYKKGMGLAFPMQYSRGFEMEKKVRKWVEEWQRLPYVSPYEDGGRMGMKKEVREKWAVGMVHEVLSLMVGMKMEMDGLGAVGEWVGLGGLKVRKMVLNYPGIFYLSNKLRTQTVVLREAYRRDLLVVKHPLMGLRYQYIHLMHKGKEGSGGDGKKKKKNKSKKKDDRRSTGDAYGDEGEEQEEDDEEEEEDGEEENEEVLGVSDIDDTEEEESDDDDDEHYGIGREARGGLEIGKVDPRRYSRKLSQVDNHQTMVLTKRNGRVRERSEGERSNGRGNTFRGDKNGRIRERSEGERSNERGNTFRGAKNGRIRERSDRERSNERGNTFRGARRSTPRTNISS